MNPFIRSSIWGKKYHPIFGLLWCINLMINYFVNVLFNLLAYFRWCIYVERYYVVWDRGSCSMNQGLYCTKSLALHPKIHLLIYALILDH
jgi:hypothetical protein